MHVDPLGTPAQQTLWIPTYTGKLIDLEAPRAELVDPLDIAVALARKPRWNGHTLLAYTVAEHSLLASYEVPREHALAALVHDAAEAYLGDVSRPLKILLGETWRSIEVRFDRLVATRFGVPYPWPEEVTRIDDVLLDCERRQLIDSAAAGDARWPQPRRPAGAWTPPIAITVNKPRVVMRSWLERLVELTGERVDFAELPPSRQAWRGQRSRPAAEQQRTNTEDNA